MMKFSAKGWYKVLEEATCYSDDIDVDVLAFDNAEQEYKLRHMEFEPDEFEMPTIHNLKKIKALGVEIEDLPTTPKEVRLTVDEAKDILWDLKLLKSFVHQVCPSEASEIKERIAQFESRIEKVESK